MQLFYRPTVENSSAGGRKEKLEKVRAGLDAARVKRTASKRFMTPERKKKLRVCKGYQITKNVVEIIQN